MYPYLRVAGLALRARWMPRIAITDESVIHTRVGITDIDINNELNNGRHLTLLDLGRTDLVARSGALRTLIKRRWGLAVGGASVRYRHRVPAWSRVTIRTRMLCHDQRWFYFHQKIQLGERTCSAALMRAGVVARGRLIEAPEVLEALHEQAWNPPMPDWVAAWVEAEGMRPWP